MSRWQEIKELTKKDDNIYKRISLIYSQYPIPVDIREHFSEWFEAQEWNLQCDEMQQDIPPAILQHASRLLSDLLQKIENEIHTSQDVVIKVNLNHRSSSLKEQFLSSPYDFLLTVQRCMDAENMLLESTRDQDEMKHNSNSPDAEAKKTFQNNIDQLFVYIETDLKPLVQKAESTAETLKYHHNRFIIDDREKQGQIVHLERSLSVDGVANEPLKNQMEALKKSRQESYLETFKLQEQMRSESNGAAESLASVIKNVWDLLDIWLTQQRLEITGLSAAPDMAHLDAIDNVFKLINEQFLRILHYQDIIQEEFERINLQQHPFMALNAELSKNLRIILEKHINKMFVVERQPNRIKKITSRKSLQYNMVVRMLGGISFGLYLNSPKVIARIFPEKDEKLKVGLEFGGAHDDPKVIPPGIAEVGNGTCTMEKQKATNNIIGIFSSYQLRKVERICNEKIGKEERVTDQKYAMVYYTKVRVMNHDYQIKAVSLPICLNTSNSQEGPSKGTLIWEAAFALKERDIWSFADHEEVLWPEVANVIQALFRRCTEKELTAEQLGYLVQRLLGVQLGTDAATLVIKRDKFLKENLPHCNFTFWKWVYACLNLIRMRLKSEWKDGLIFGFIGRELTKDILKGKPKGTFLLRFSDSSIEESQSSEVPGCLTVAVLHENPKKLGKAKVTFVTDFLKTDHLRKHGLAAILEGYCYKEARDKDALKPLISRVLNSSKEIINFKEAFHQYFDRKEEKKDKDYAATKKKKVPTATLR